MDGESKNFFTSSFITGVIVLVAVIGIAWYFANNNSTQTSGNDETTDGYDITLNTSTSTQTMTETKKPGEDTAGGNPVATLKTNLGTITIELLADKAPKTVENFVKLAESGFYDGTRFHRVIKDFMIQGGDPLSKDASKQQLWGTGGPGYQFANEINDVKLVRGILAMANAGPNTNGSQFFIVTTEATPWLDGKHTAFGRVTSGMDVVDKIEGTPTGAADRPTSDVILEKVTIAK